MEKIIMTIQFRPHHFLCAFCFEGKGYSPAFVSNFQRIMDKLQHAGDTEIQITSHTDSICAPCPHRQGKSCDSEAHIQELDAKHREALQLENTPSISWANARERIKENISLDVFHRICASCEWKSLGICEQKLKSL
jgi:uncharacterized protein